MLGHVQFRHVWKYLDRCRHVQTCPDKSAQICKMFWLPSSYYWLVGRCTRLPRPVLPGCKAECSPIHFYQQGNSQLPSGARTNTGSRYAQTSKCTQNVRNCISRLPRQYPLIIVFWEEDAELCPEHSQQVQFKVSLKSGCSKGTTVPNRKCILKTLNYFDDCSMIGPAPQHTFNDEFMSDMCRALCEVTCSSSLVRTSPLCSSSLLLGLSYGSFYSPHALNNFLRMRTD